MVSRHVVELRAFAGAFQLPLAPAMRDPPLPAVERKRGGSFPVRHGAMPQAVGSVLGEQGAAWRGAAPWDRLTLSCCTNAS